MRNQLYFILLFFISISQTYAQDLSFKSTSLADIFENIESQTDYRFNYDSDRIAKETFTGTIDISDIKSALQILLKNKALSAKTKKNIILITPSTDHIKPEEGHLCGYIKSHKDGVAIADANVYLEGANLSSFSDEQGFFSLSGKMSPTDKLVINHIQFHTKKISLENRLDGDCQTIILDEENIQLDSVFVKYIYPEISEGKPYGAISINAPKLFDNHIIPEPDILKITQQLPGITSTDESASNLNIRGTTFDQNLIVWEGITLYHSSHVLGVMSSVNPFVIDKMDVYRSVYHPVYDDRLGGVIDIGLTDKITKVLRAGSGSTLADSHLYIDVPIARNKLAILGSGRISTNGILRSPIITNYSEKIFSTVTTGEEASTTITGFNDSNDQLRYYDVCGKVIYEPSKRVQLQASYLISDDDIDYVSNQTANDLQSDESVEQKTEAYRIQSLIKWSEKVRSTLFVSQSEYSSSNQAILSNPDENDVSFVNQYTNHIKDTKFGIVNMLRLGQKVSLDLGYTNGNIDVDYDISQTINTSSERSGANVSQGRFHNLLASARLQVNRLDILGGLRQTYYREAGRWFTSPRVNMQYVIKDDLKLKLSTGLFNQFVSQIEDFGSDVLQTKTDFWVLAQSETGHHLEAKKVTLGFVYKPGSWLFDVESYYNYSSGISSLSAAQNTDGLIEGTNKSEVVGIDFLIKRNWRNYNFWLNYTLSKNTFVSQSASLSRFPANIDQRHRLSVFNTYRWRRWHLSLTYHYKSGLPYSIPTGIEQTMSEESSSPTSRLAYDDLNNHRLKEYNRLDLGVSYKTKVFNDRVSFEANASVLNLFDRENPYSKNHFIADTESSTDIRINSIQTFQLRRTPQLLLRFYW